jgi:hypothetical protein
MWTVFAVEIVKLLRLVNAIATIRFSGPYSRSMMVNDLRRRSCKRLKLSKYVALDSYTYLYIPIHTYTYLYIPIHTYAEKTMRKLGWSLGSSFSRLCQYQLDPFSPSNLKSIDRLFCHPTLCVCQSVLLFLIVAQVPVKVPQTSQCRRQFAVVCASGSDELHVNVGKQ